LPGSFSGLRPPQDDGKAQQAKDPVILGAPGFGSGAASIDETLRR
jgi:hypothetical protein